MNLLVVPAGCSQSSDPSLEDARVKCEGVFPSHGEEYQWQDEPAMNDESNYDRDHVHPQLSRYHFQVTDGSNFPTDEGGNAKWRVPEDRPVELLGGQLWGFSCSV